MDPEELQKKEKQILDTVAGLERAIQENTAYSNKVAKLSMLSTGGQVPDYRQYSDEDLRDVFDMAMRNGALNNLPVVTDPRTGKAMEGTHPYSMDSINDQGLTGNDLSRKQLIEAIDSLLKHNNYNIDPIELAKNQDMMMDASGAQLAGYVTNVKLDNLNLREQQTKDTGVKYKNTAVTDQLDLLDKHLEEYEMHIANLAGEAVTYAVGQKLESVRGASPEDVAKVFDLARQASDNRNRSDAMDQVGEDVAIQTRVDLSNLDLEGIDLSKSDLSGIKMNAETLATTKGFETAKGVSESMKDLARSFQTPEHAKIVKYEAQLEKLKNPGFFDYLRSIRHGGIEGAKQHLIDKIDKAKIELTHKMDVELSDRVQKQEKGVVEKLEGRQKELAPDALDYMEAEQKVKAAHVLEALSEGSLGGGMTVKEQRELEKMRNENLEVMSDKVNAHKEYRKNEEEIGSLRKNVSVRESLGPKQKPSKDEPKVSQGQGL